MTQKLTGKQINEFANTRNDLPDYFGGTIWLPTPEYKKIKANGELLAQRYKAIVKIVEDKKAQVKIFGNTIFISYNNGEIKIGRDLLVDTFLLPQLPIDQPTFTKD